MSVVTIVICAVALSMQVSSPSAYSELPVGAKTPPVPVGKNSAATPVELLPPPANARGRPVDVSKSAAVATAPANSATTETIEQAWSIATANHPFLKARQHEIAAADHWLNRSKAESHPTWSLTGGYTARDREPGFRLQSQSFPGVSGVFPSAQDHGSSFGACVKLPLYTSGQIEHGVAEAEANRHVADQQLTTTTMDLKLRVADAYTNVMRAQCDAAVARCRVASLESHVHEVRSLLEHRQVQRSDLLAANVAFSNARYQEVQAANRLDVAQAEYNRLLGRSLDHPVQLSEPQPPRLEGDLNDLTDRALLQRPELTTLALQGKAVSEKAGAARAANKPRVDLLGEYAYEENRYQDPEGIAAVALTVSWNFLDGGRSRSQAEALDQESASIAMVRSDLESTVRLEVRKAWLDYWEAQRRIGISTDALVQADENLRVSTQNYAAGFATNTEVLNAVTYRAESQRDRQHAVYDAVLAALRIRRAIGELK